MEQQSILVLNKITEYLAMTDIINLSKTSKRMYDKISKISIIDNLNKIRVQSINAESQHLLNKLNNLNWKNKLKSLLLIFSVYLILIYIIIDRYDIQCYLYLIIEFILCYNFGNKVQFRKDCLIQVLIIMFIFIILEFDINPGNFILTIGLSIYILFQYQMMILNWYNPSHWKKLMHNIVCNGNKLHIDFFEKLCGQNFVSGNFLFELILLSCINDNIDFFIFLTRDKDLDQSIEIHDCFFSKYCSTKRLIVKHIIKYDSISIYKYLDSKFMDSSYYKHVLLYRHKPHRILNAI